MVFSSGTGAGSGERGEGGFMMGEAKEVRGRAERRMVRMVVVEESILNVFRGGGVGACFKRVCVSERKCV